MCTIQGKYGEFDPHILEALYPDVASVFSWRLKSLEDIKGHCVVVLDTNTLVLPYTVSPKNLDQIGNTYQRLIGEGRLIVPGRVAREFAKLRAVKLAELHQQLSDQKSKAVALKTDRYPLLESVDEYRETLDLEAKVNNSLKEYKKAIERMMEQVLGWGQSDPVSDLYRNLFGASAIFDHEFDPEDVREDLQHRRIHKLPPGYKDASKDDGGIGDLIIWRTILELGKERNSNVMFVTSDLKADWWHRGSGNAPLYPRHELVEEYRRTSGDRSFHLVTFSGFLELYGADESAVQETRRGEAAQQADVNDEKDAPLGHVRISVRGERGESVPGAQVLLGADNGTHQHGATDQNGMVTLPSPQRGRLRVLCACEGFRGYVQHQVDTKHGVNVRIQESGADSGATLCIGGTGHVPGLAGRLNPIHDNLDRYYIYADNVAINGGQDQPVPFTVGETFPVQDSYGRQFDLSVIEMVGRTALIEYSLTGLA